MREYLNKKINNKILSKIDLNNVGYLPRWSVLFLDILVISFATALTYYLFKGINLKFITTQYEGIKIPLYFFVNIFFFWIFKTYSGIIRHSSIVDAVKIFFAQFFAFSSLVIIDAFSKTFFSVDLYFTTALLVNSFIVFCLLFFYRVFVKKVFEIYFSNILVGKQEILLIYGSDANAIAVANALLSEIPKRFHIKGFIDKYQSNDSKRALGLPIFCVRENLSNLFEQNNVSGLVIADKSLTREDQIQLVDECLELGIKVFTVPLVTDWENQKEISKKIKSFEIEDLLDRKPIVLNNKAISSTHTNKTVLITGAAGSIGSEIVRQVIDFKPDVLLLIDQAESPLHNLLIELDKYDTSSINIIAKVADIRDKQRLEILFKKYLPKIVYHAAAYKHVPLMEENPSQAIFVNVMGTSNLADLAVQYQVDRFVMVSTDKAVNPSNVMGASKRIAEKYVQSLHFELLKKNIKTTKFITTRFGNVLGSNGSVVPLFTKQISEGGPVTITHKDIIRYFMTIPEACQLVLEAGTMGNGGEIYIFDMGKPVKIYSLAEKMIRLAGLIPNVDIKIKEIGLRPGEKLYEELLKDDSKTLPTHHEKILVAQDMIEDYKCVKENIQLLIDTTFNYSNNDIVGYMKMIVPEFKSLNSDYEILDKN
ncbi:polysaccharide biosynthesis protein [Flavobacterium columnare]|uniref:polysaccharide biosynthesis protein n=1 Tax=Flavobacterium columnare TaxID=996 RepID=UPI0007F9BB45|nr:nucleoside-diphosphate sugar epimerase/dehydratase [Flavobacterium columnare]ANO48363.1 WbpM protein involved in UDP-D-Qui2NAc biosynthesis (a nucleotide sugar precursor for antigen-O biosynthesis) [Flavobacterium columnare]MBF6655531.1 polysaccharide biosynthesis protein [Flavobacterium columnare]MBF6658386.1 polysaccharide biosynthesis protein [Flavobacterium columnare]OOB81760.1 polysaccharide biosynthesis protein [Flavobacterium columnare]PTD14825.1 polysaccharide biosynthesis protein [